jgi:hypothetical protein
MQEKREKERWLFPFMKEKNGYVIVQSRKEGNNYKQENNVQDVKLWFFFIKK